jgi:hypothetical protein
LIVACDVFGLGVPFLSTTSSWRAGELLRLQSTRAGFPLPEVATPGSDDAGFRRMGFEAALLTTLPADGSTRAWRAMHTTADTTALIDWAALEGVEAFVASIAALPVTGEMVREVDAARQLTLQRGRSPLGALEQLPLW